MTYIDGILEDIREKENKPLDTLTAWRLIESSYIWRTSKLCISNMIIPDSIVYKEFKPNMIIRVFIPFVIVLYWIVVIPGFTQYGFGTAIKGLIFLSVITFAMAELLYLTGVSKNRNFKILINKEEIKIGVKAYKWENIKETAILYLPIRRNGIYYLIIVFSDGSYEKFDLSNFRSFKGFTRVLSTYIEYFNRKPEPALSHW